MATRVEVGSLSSLPGVPPGLGEIPTEETLKRSYFRQAEGVPSVQILDGKSPLRSSGRLFPLPRLAPKPFSKEKALDVRAPVISLQPGVSRPFSSGGFSRDVLVKGLDEKMPTQEAEGQEGPRRSLSFHSKSSLFQPNPSTVILFETIKTGPALGKGNIEGTQEAKAGVPQEPPSGFRPEVAPKPALPARKPSGTFPRPAPLSEETRPAVNQEERAESEPPSKPPSGLEDMAGPAVETRPGLKRRPMSAIFLESAQPQKLAHGGVAVVGRSPPTPPEKSWVRKPRPLSMDLTAPFESKEVLLKKKASEMNGAVMVPTAQGQRTERASAEPTGSGVCSVKAEGPPHDVDSDCVEVAKRPREWTERTLFKQAEVGMFRTAGDSARVTPRDDQSLGDENAKPDGEAERMPESPRPRSGKGHESAEAKGRVAAGEVRAAETWAPRGSVKKRISLFGDEGASAVAVGPTPALATPESPSAAPEPEKGGVSVQERIKGWAVESTEAKRDQEARRRTFQARTPSVDSNKAFSSPASSREGQYEKRPEASRKLPEDARQKHKEGPSLEGHGASASRSPWKPGTLQEKAKPTERKDSRSHDPDSCPRDNVVGSSCTSAVTPEDEGTFQTVWATVFEHHVERHHVADQSRRGCPPAVVTGGAPDARVSESRPRPDRGAWLGKPPPEPADLKRESLRGLANPEAEKLGRTALLNGGPRESHQTLPVGEKRSSSPFYKHSTSLPVAQKIEPRYDIVHAVGTRAHSQAVHVAPEEKAVTLRSSEAGPAQRERRPSPEAPAPDPAATPEGQPGSVQRASLLWQARGLPKPDLQDPKEVSGRACSSPKWTGGPSASWSKATVVVSEEKGSGLSPPGACERPAGSCTPEAPPARVVKASVREAQPEERETAGNKPAGYLSKDKGGPSQGWAPDPPSRAKEEFADIRAFSVQKGPLVVAPSEGDPRPAPGPEPEVKMRRANPGDQRMERWRRRTLPHNVRFEEFGFLTPEHSPKVERQTDLLTLTAGAIRQLAHSRGGARDGTPALSPDWTFPAEKQGSPVEPKATFFAVTYQIPDAEKAKGTVVQSAPDNLMEHSRKVAPPPSPHSFSPTLVSLHREEPGQAVGSKNWAKQRESDRVNLSKNLKPAGRPVSLGDGILDPSRERAIDVDALWVHRASDDSGGFRNARKDGGNRTSASSPAKMTPTFQSPPKVSQPARRRTEVVSETFPGKIKDGYRSSVLDLDALMAEYKERSARGPGEARDWEESAPVEVSSLPRGRPDLRGGLEQRRKNLKETMQVEGLWKQAGSAEPKRSSPAGPGKQSVDTLDLAATTKLNPPLWAPPHPAPEQHLGTASGPVGPRKTALGAPEEDKKPPGGKHSTSRQSYPAEPKPPGQEDLKIGASDPSRCAPTDQKKGTSKKAIGRGDEGTGTQWGDHTQDSRRPLLDVKRACSEKGPPAHIQEGQSILQEARERRRELAKGRPSLSREGSEAFETKTGSFRRESGTREDPKMLPRDPGMEDVFQDYEQPIRWVSPSVPGPRRSHSFCRDRRSGPLVDQLKQCFSRRPPEAKDTDTLVQEGDSQYGTWTEPRQSAESLAPESPSLDSSTTSTRKQPPSSRLSSLSSQTEVTSAGDPNDGSRGQWSTSVDRSSTDLDSTDGTEGLAAPDAFPRPGADDFSFLDQTPVLDSSALKSRVQLSKRRLRRAPASHSLRRSRLSESESRSPLDEGLDSAWMFKDSTEEKSPKREESDEEEKLPKTEKTPVGLPQRTPALPGMDPATLKAQLHRWQGPDSPGDTPTRTPQPKTPKSPFQLGSRVLPSSVDRDERLEEPSPQWLKELKSKKRRSLYENQA